MILSDLFYHLQGELEGRKITAGSFKELSQYLVESTFFQTHQHQHDTDLFITGKDVFVFDPERIRADLGSDLWDYSKLQTSKAIMETMLHCMEDANLMILITSSKLSAVKALVTVLTVYEHEVSQILCCFILQFTYFELRSKADALWWKPFCDKSLQMVSDLYRIDLYPSPYNPFLK